MPEAPRFIHNKCGGVMMFDKEAREFVCVKCQRGAEQIVVVQSARVELLARVSAEDLMMLYECKTIH